MNEFVKYETLKMEESSALDAYLTAKADGLDALTRVRMLREVYQLSLEDAKRVSFEGDTGEAFNEGEGKHVEDYERVLDEELGCDDLK